MTPRPIPALAVLLLVVQAALLPIPRSDGHLLSSDGGYYYAYMRSLLLDGDLDVANDVVLYNARVPSESTARLRESYEFSIGPGLLWSPFFLAGHGIARIAAAAGGKEPPDGFGFLEEASVQLGSVVYAAIALFLLAGLARRLAPEGRPEIAVALTFLASPAIYYAVFEPTMSHTLELFSVSLFLWLLFVRPLRTTRDLVLLGAAAGLVFLVRWQNVVLWIAAAPLVLGRAPFEGRRLALRDALAATAGAAPVVFLQMAFWKVTLGSFVTVPQGPGFLTPLRPHLLGALFSTRHGLLSWHPVFALGLAGLAVLRPRPAAVALALAFAADLYVCSIAGDWWGGHAFGMRRMIGTVPLVVPGVAAGIAALRARGRSERWLLASLAILVAWNFAFVVQYRLGMIPPGDALTFREMVLDKLTLPFALAHRVTG